VIVLDEHLQGTQLDEILARWYRGRVCFIGALRPGSIVKDDGIPHLLRTARQPTFVTQNWKHFWERTEPHDDYCLICFISPSEQASEIAPLLRRVLRLPAFQGRAARMGKIARVSGGQVIYYQARDPQLHVLPLAEARGTKER
jgi:hypothetical protein